MRRDFNTGQRKSLEADRVKLNRQRRNASENMTFRFRKEVHVK